MWESDLWKQPLEFPNIIEDGPTTSDHCRKRIPEDVTTKSEGIQTEQRQGL